jgi:hypothetical protein
VAAGTANVTACTITANHTHGFGGGLSCVDATVTTSTVSENTADSDGGGVFSIHTTTMDRSTVSDNLAGGNGGGIKALTAKLTNVTVSGNSAGVGHGTANNGVVPASGGGGGVFATHGTLLNCTIVENFATGFGGGVNTDGVTDLVHVKNTIIARNFVQSLSIGPDAIGNFVSDGHNLIGIFIDQGGFGAGGFVFGAKGDQLGTADTPIDPLLGPLANNGGPTKTHALLAGSPAIDRGDNSGAPATDQRGVARARDGDGNGSKIVDIGAFEK